MATIFRIKLAKVRIEKNGYFEDLDELKGKKVENGVEATLVYPTPGLPAVKSIRTMKLKQGQEVAYYSKESFREIEALLTFLLDIQLPDLDTTKLDAFIQSPKLFEFDDLIGKLEKFRKGKKADQLETLRENVNRLLQEEQFNLLNLKTKETLFRQPIQGNSFLEVQISAVRKANEFEKLFTSIIFAGLKGASGAITGFKGLTAIATTTTGSLLEMFAPKDKKHIIGYGVVQIDESTLVKETLKVDLFVPKTFSLKTPSEYDKYNNRILSFATKKFVKGEFNGYSEFTLVKEGT